MILLKSKHNDTIKEISTQKFDDICSLLKEKLT